MTRRRLKKADLLGVDTTEAEVVLKALIDARW